ncbi:unnamed protein product [Didymodactylos carnosus]|uniref:SH3 domain-containing protein n=1 Tax=Didymodactylos carnosus TaxID=1234261 RepID=A0A8S2ENK1_9BILA|nr:unnamed protein product [Didymodactylos carnosus]CAF4020612.1 unnamed protein product [Didymodactylos carnosus]
MTEPDSSELEERSSNVSDSEQSGRDSKTNPTNVSMVATELIDKHVRQHRQSRLSAHSGEQSDVEYFLSDFILKEDYCDNGRDVYMSKGDIVEIVDIEKKEKWLVRNKKNLNQVCYVPPELLEVIQDISLPSSPTYEVFDEEQQEAPKQVSCAVNPCGLVANQFDGATGYYCQDIPPTYQNSICICPGNVVTSNCPCRMFMQN